MAIQKYFKSALSISVLLFAAQADGQVVYKTSFMQDANVRVYVTQYKQEADVVVFKTPFIHNADGNEGIWYFTSYQGEANKRVIFVPAKNEANLIVFWTEKKAEAGWLNKRKKYLMK